MAARQKIQLISQQVCGCGLGLDFTHMNPWCKFFNVCMAGDVISGLGMLNSWGGEGNTFNTKEIKYCPMQSINELYKISSL